MASFLLNNRTYRLGNQPATPLHLEHILPATLPKHWHGDQAGLDRWCQMLGPYAPKPGYAAVYGSQTGLRVILTASIEVDRKRWLHVSVSHRGGRLPNWNEMCDVKDVFCGEDATAYQIHPAKSQHVSIHDKCLHLWSCLDGPVTPDFTRGGESI